MGHDQRGFVLKAVAWMIGLAVVAIAAVFAVNATDEELSGLAKKAMTVPPVPPPTPGNAYQDLAALDGANLDQRLKRACGPSPDLCLKLPADDPELVKLNAGDDAFMKGYRAMRAKPEFTDRHESKSPGDTIPPYQYLVWGQGRSLLHAASLVHRGRLEAAVAELEAENAFHRRIAAGSRSLITKTIAILLLQRDALFASDLARLPGPRASAMLGRLRAVVRPLSAAEADMRRNFEIERAEQMSWMLTRRHVRMPDDHYRFGKEFFGRTGERPWWDAAAPYLYRPHQSVNRYAAQTEILLSVSALPPTEYAAGAAAAVAKAHELTPAGLVSLLINPAGHDHPHLSITRGYKGDPDGITPYIGRAHATQGLYTLVSLQIALREAGVGSVADVERALDGPVFRAHPDPFTGKPMRFDAGSRTIGFDAPMKQWPFPFEFMRKRHGRVAVEVAH